MSTELGPAAAQPSGNLNYRPLILIGIGVLAAIGAIVALVLAISGPSTFELRGTLDLTDASLGYKSGDPSCRGTGGYSDIHVGAAVTVYDSAGTVLAISHLNTSELSEDKLNCTFTFVVPEVPDGHSFYAVEVSHRGKVTLTADEARERGAMLSLGL